MLQVNLQHKKTAMDALWLKVQREEVDVVFIQEPYVLAAIVFRKTLPMLQDGEMTDRYTTAVVLKASPPIYLVSTYMPGDMGVEHQTRRLARKQNWGRLRRRMIWACDTNAHSALWYSKSENRRGREMEAFAIQQGLAVMNRRSRFTTYDGSRGATNID
ncbi:unnamed protein product, partial [Heterosigma akashiwo]